MAVKKLISESEKGSLKDLIRAVQNRVDDLEDENVTEGIVPNKTFDFDGHKFDPESTWGDIWYDVIDPIIDEYAGMHPNWEDDVDAALRQFLEEFGQYPNVVTACDKFFDDYTTESLEIKQVKESKGSTTSLLKAVQDRIKELSDIDSVEENCVVDEDIVGNVIETQPALPESIRTKIINIFDLYDVVILSTDTQKELTDGVMYSYFIVETDDMSRITMGSLDNALKKLEDSDDIGYEKNSNRNGTYAATYYFYRFHD